MQTNCRAARKINKTRIAAAVAYDGNAFCGWQTQPRQCAAQDAIQKALSQIAAENITITAAGRTDTGVHALSQIIHFDTNTAREEKEWLRGANHLLRPRATLLWAREVDSDFHARYGALSRRYCYVICEDDSLAPFLSGKVFFRDGALNIGKMREAAKALIGKNDFTSFRAAGCSAKTPVRHLREITFNETPPFTTISFRADGFLRRMVLNITGALLTVGRGEQQPQWTDALLKAKDRTPAPPPAKACGLYFLGAQYPKEFNLPLRRLTTYSVFECGTGRAVA